MQLKVIGTGSSGNCYVLKDADGQLFAVEEIVGELVVFCPQWKSLAGG